MKHLLITAAAILISLASMAQNSEILIEVQGVAPFEKAIDQYHAEISLSLNAYYSYDGSKPSLEELKEDFFKRMKENGFNQDQFKVDSTQEYSGANYYNEGIAIYSFSTDSEEVFLKFMGVRKLNGMQITTSTVTYKPLADRENLIAAAVEDAKKQAAVVAKAVGRSLGELRQVTDCNRHYEDIPGSHYPNNQQSKYYIVAKFALQ